MYEVWLKLTIKTPERRQCCSVFLLINRFHLVLVFDYWIWLSKWRLSYIKHHTQTKPANTNSMLTGYIPSPLLGLRIHVWKEFITKWRTGSSIKGFWVNLQFSLTAALRKLSRFLFFCMNLFLLGNQLKFKVTVHKLKNSA